MIKNSTQYEYTCIQNYAFKWLKIFSAICLINAGLLFFFNGPEYPKYEEFSMLLPFAHCGIVWIGLIFYRIYYWANLDKNSDAQYIKKNYPKIWNNLHPWGDFSYNSFASIKFIQGKYDDGDDEKLNKIFPENEAPRRKRTGYWKTIINLKIILWTFFLIPIIWFINVAVLISSGIINKV